MSGLIYLAGPYTAGDASERLRQYRFETLSMVAAKLMKQGLRVYSPISHGVPIAKAGDLPGDAKFWADHNHFILSKCQKVIVVMLPGWMESDGITDEIKVAEALDLVIEYKTLEELMGKWSA